MSDCNYLHIKRYKLNRIISVVNVLSIEAGLTKEEKGKPCVYITYLNGDVNILIVDNKENSLLLVNDLAECFKIKTLEEPKPSEGKKKPSDR